MFIQACITVGKHDKQAANNFSRKMVNGLNNKFYYLNYPSAC